VSCKAALPRTCLDRIESALDRVRAGGERRSFCIPPMWSPFLPSTRYPVALLDYVLLRLSAARIGRAGEPTEAVLRDLLAEMYPCHALRAGTETGTPRPRVPFN
jgi:hypothetical protein